MLSTSDFEGAGAHSLVIPVQNETYHTFFQPSFPRLLMPQAAPLLYSLSQTYPEPLALQEAELRLVPHLLFWRPCKLALSLPQTLASQCFLLHMVLAPWKESCDNLRQHIKKERQYFADKGLSSQSYGFSISRVWV